MVITIQHYNRSTIDDPTINQCFPPSHTAMSSLMPKTPPVRFSSSGSSVAFLPERPEVVGEKTMGKRRKIIGQSWKIKGKSWKLLGNHGKSQESHGKTMGNWWKTWRNTWKTIEKQTGKGWYRGWLKPSNGVDHLSTGAGFLTSTVGCTNESMDCL